MKKEELRVGNYVFNQLRLNLKKITEIREKMCSIYYLRSDTGTYHTSMVDYTVLVPIPLTEEWLLKFGAKKVDEYWFSFHSYGIIKHNTFIELYSGVKGDYICNSVKYVHQLQNLYFALTNENLTIV